MSDRPWLAAYGAVPHTIDYPEITVEEAVRRTVRRTPDAVAYEFLGSAATYRELGSAIDRCADGLAALGLGPGDRLTISLPTSPPALIAFYAAARLGVVPSLIHPRSSPAEVAGFVSRSRSRCALTLDVLHGSFEQASLETLVLVPTGAPRPAGARWWPELLAGHPAASPATTAAGEPAAILYSGGTTGTPKGIVLSHRNLVSAGMQAAAWVGMDADDAVLAVLPIFHGFGLSVLVNSALMAGARVVLVPEFSPPVVAGLLGSTRVTLMAGPPTLYEALARDPALQEVDLAPLRAAFTGADWLPPAVRERFERLVAERGGRVRLLEGYGLTEAVSAVAGSPLAGGPPGSAGVPFPDTLLRICDPAGTALGPGEIGEIHVSGPAVMLGYLDDPEATAAAIVTDGDGRRWLRTDDLGSLDADGFLTVAGRLKRLIKNSGYGVHPAQVEAVLCTHPAVEQACVVGVPHPTRGQSVKAFVVCRNAAEGTPELAAALVARCRTELSPWSCPREVEFLRELPLTRLGKVDAAALTPRPG